MVKRQCPGAFPFTCNSLKKTGHAGCTTISLCWRLYSVSILHPFWTLQTAGLWTALITSLNHHRPIGLMKHWALLEQTPKTAVQSGPSFCARRWQKPCVTLSGSFLLPRCSLSIKVSVRAYGYTTTNLRDSRARIINWQEGGDYYILSVP
ncbi:hypothetical protein LY76DRAFT_409773 [Colletotrichum caudatum]|nr:hypothetical protein LY76DRAFT_409773 [Colletotrichum caudatum]